MLSRKQALEQRPRPAARQTAKPAAGTVNQRVNVGRLQIQNSSCPHPTVEVLEEGLRVDNMFNDVDGCDHLKVRELRRSFLNAPAMNSKATAARDFDGSAGNIQSEGLDAEQFRGRGQKRTRVTPDIEQALP
jgi:hypothetical protein